MIAENINKSAGKPRILIAPLDWGLGHASRCIPIIKQLQELDIEVILAGEGPIVVLLLQEFPGLVVLPLKGYRIKYARNKWLFIRMLFQAPKIYSVIQHEQRWLKLMVKAYKIDAVISDNRPGLYHL